jgi:hypothetical protein
VQRQRGEAVVRKRADHFLGIAAHVAEDQARFWLVLQQQRRQQRRSLRGFDLEEALLDRGRFHAAVDADLDRVAQHRVGHRADRVGKRRGKQEALAVLRRLADDLADRFLEAHVEHAIGLVQHQRAHAAEVQRLLAHQFLDASGRADHHMRIVRERSELRSKRDAAAQHRNLQIGDGEGELAQLLADLVGEFARRAQHQRLGASERRIEPVQQAESERGGLAAAGRRLRDQVAAIEDGGQALHLDRCHPGIAERFDALQQSRRQRQGIEGGQRGHVAMIAALGDLDWRSGLDAAVLRATSFTMGRGLFRGADSPISWP